MKENEIKNIIFCFFHGSGIKRVNTPQSNANKKKQQLSI